MDCRFVCLLCRNWKNEGENLAESFEMRVGLFLNSQPEEGGNDDACAGRMDGRTR